MSYKLMKTMSLFLGIQMFLFGFLKFFQPFQGWFDVQVLQSHLPHQAILFGKLGEIVTGLLFLLPWILRSLKEKQKSQVLLIASCCLIFEMGVAIYVHLQPQVPTEVLPLGIRPPVIPIITLLLACATIFVVWRQWQSRTSNHGWIK